jgi:tRNA dimethylallyltransferase
MKKVIILLGPTGVGKTGVSILLAQHLKTEIISADSMQIYRHMDIGTAKPTPKQRMSTKHHMIDIIDPRESFSTGKYVATVLPIIENLNAQGKIPLIVGGTGLYIRAMTRGIFSGPSADWPLRHELLAMEKERGGSLYRCLEKIDPEAASTITPRDTRRTIRALEVCLKSTTKMSAMQRHFTHPLPFEFIKIGIRRDRKELYRMIEDRVDAMINSGLVGEVKSVLEMNPDRTPLQAIGYKELVRHVHGEIPLDEAVGLIKRNTKRYAKRQYTWFRKEEGIHWVDITGIRDHHIIFDHLMHFLLDFRHA